MSQFPSSPYANDQGASFLSGYVPPPSADPFIVRNPKVNPAPIGYSSPAQNPGPPVATPQLLAFIPLELSSPLSLDVACYISTVTMESSWRLSCAASGKKVDCLFVLPLKHEGTVTAVVIDIGGARRIATLVVPEDEAASYGAQGSKDAIPQDSTKYNPELFRMTIPQVVVHMAARIMKQQLDLPTAQARLAKDDKLKQRVVDLSVAEGVPSEHTAMIGLETTPEKYGKLKEGMKNRGLPDCRLGALQFLAGLVTLLTIPGQVSAAGRGLQAASGNLGGSVNFADLLVLATAVVKTPTRQLLAFAAVLALWAFLTQPAFRNYLGTSLREFQSKVVGGLLSAWMLLLLVHLVAPLVFAIFPPLAELDRWPLVTYVTLLDQFGRMTNNSPLTVSQSATTRMRVFALAGNPLLSVAKHVAMFFLRFITVTVLTAVLGIWDSFVVDSTARGDIGAWWGQVLGMM